MADTPPDAARAGDERPGFPVVGLGASAGGVEALSSFFAAVPAATGMAYVVVTHLGPGHEALLDAILGRQAAIPILRAVDGQALQPDHAYVLSAAATLTLRENRLHLADRDLRQHHPIDTFLVSLAEDRGPAAVGVLLSGGGSDGTIGLQAIRQGGGLTVAQGSDGTAPAQTSMPDSAIAAGMVDLVLPVQQIPDRLVGFARALARPNGLVAAELPPPELAGLRRAICEVLRAQLGHDFSGYKEASFLRRVQRRMHVLQLENPAAYLEHLRREPEEVVRLFQDLLIGVTSFFRDQDAFEMLGKSVLPQLLEGRGADATVRIWVPGCATG
jgi:two-component system, chemotaxis family, CheB/CheR fusion protein